MFDGDLVPSEEAAKLIRRARIKAREIGTKIEEAGGPYESLVYDAYNAMFMAARGALHALGHECNSHRTVLAKYRHEVVETGKIDPKYEGYLTKIQGYWEAEQAGEKQEIDAARAGRISEATREIVDSLAVIAGVTKPSADLAKQRGIYSG